MRSTHENWYSWNPKSKMFEIHLTWDPTRNTYTLPKLHGVGNVWLLATQAWHQNSAANQEQIKNSILNQSRDGKSDLEGGNANPIAVIWAKRTKSD